MKLIVYKGFIQYSYNHNKTRSLVDLHAKIFLLIFNILKIEINIILFDIYFILKDNIKAGGYHDGQR